MTENHIEENRSKSSTENTHDSTLHIITYKSSNLHEGKYRYDSITNKLIEVSSE